MAAPPRQPLFLARSSYRQRRLRDALRVLPVAGVILFTLPLLWPRGPEGPGNATVLIYLFSVWALLVLAGALMVRRLRPDEHPEGAPPPEGGP